MDWDSLAEALLLMEEEANSKLKEDSDVSSSHSISS